MTRSDPRRRLGLAGVFFCLLQLWIASTPVFAQNERRGAAAGDFDFYVLALSWSPGFCSVGGGDDKGLDQCRNGSGLGFVVHGLWPQYDRGFPSECSPANRTPSRIALESAKGVFPDEGLARYEWRKHGTCSGKSPTDYFADVRAARDSVVIPKALVSPPVDQTFAPLDLERAFAAANPGLRPDMMAVDCRSSTLEEVRICFSKDLRSFQTCPEVNRRGCRTRDMKVPAVR
ncbi:MAG: ribonuclease T2 [Alsobacter sp.]